MHTRETLAADARHLGVEPGDTLLVYPSFKSLGPVEGGAATWNIATTPSTVGYLTEFFRTMPGTVRSDHYRLGSRHAGSETFLQVVPGMKGTNS